MKVNIGRSKPFEGEGDRIRVYHTRVKLADKPYTRRYAKQSSPAWEVLLFDLPGIEGIQVGCYSIGVHLGQQFEWDEIESSIKVILAGAHIGIESVVKKSP